MIRLKAIWHFYKSIALICLLITGAVVFVCFLFYQKGASHVFLFTFVLGKILCNGLIGYLKRSVHQDQLYFYRNLGISKIALWAWVMGLDFLIFFTGLSAALLI